MTEMISLKDTIMAIKKMNMKKFIDTKEMNKPNS